MNAEKSARAIYDFRLTCDGKGAETGVDCAGKVQHGICLRMGEGLRP